MDIKEALFGIVNSDTMRPSYIAIEKLIAVMMNDYLKKQNKRFEGDRYNSVQIYDMVFPDGIDDEKGYIAVDIKVLRHPQMILKMIYDTVGRFSMNRGESDKLLLIVVNEVPERIINKIEEKKAQLNFELLVWDIDKLVEIFSQNERLFEETYININNVLMKDAVNSGITRSNQSYLTKRSKHIEQLKKEYENDNVVLFLGAGVSIDAKIATWDNLISELFVALIDKQLLANNIQIEKKDKKKILKEIASQNGTSPLLQTRFLRSGFESEFEELVREILYKNAVDTSVLLEEIGQLCVPNRGKLGVRAVVNYNFDDLIEKALKKLRVKFHSIYSEGMLTASDEIGIYHVHGFLPQNKEVYNDLSKSLLVFSEEGYHKLMIDPYNWANMNQLNFLCNHTCVFIGLSMTDLNLRRLLEIAAQKRMDDNFECRHYAIMRKFEIKNSSNDSIKSFENVNESLQESFFREMGINVIWIKEFSEIPKILKEIKGNFDSV